MLREGEGLSQDAVLGVEVKQKWREAEPEMLMATCFHVGGRGHTQSFRNNPLRRAQPRRVQSRRGPASQGPVSQSPASQSLASQGPAL